MKNKDQQEWKEEFLDAFCHDFGLLLGGATENARAYIKNNLFSKFDSELSLREKQVREKMINSYKDTLCEAGFAIETIIGYVDMGNKEEAERHLVMLSRNLLDQATTEINNLKKST